jgi:hypothetical protein
MDNKLESLTKDLNALNPRSRIEQGILPRLERTREMYSIEPDIFTQSGKRVLKRPNLNKSNRRSPGGSRVIMSEDRSAPVGVGPGTGRVETESEALLRESTRRLRNILNDSTLATTALGSKPLKPIIHTPNGTSNEADATRSMSKLKLNGNGTSSATTNGNEHQDYNNSSHSETKKAVYFNDNVEYRRPNDDDIASPKEL